MISRLKKCAQQSRYLLSAAGVMVYNGGTRRGGANTFAAKKRIFFIPNSCHFLLQFLATLKRKSSALSLSLSCCWVPFVCPLSGKVPFGSILSSYGKTVRVPETSSLVTASNFKVDPQQQLKGNRFDDNLVKQVVLCCPRPFLPASLPALSQAPSSPLSRSPARNSCSKTGFPSP